MRNLNLEFLEERNLLSASLVNNTLVLLGSPKQDSFQISSDGTNLTVLEGNKTQTFSVSSVSSILADTQAGNDTVVNNTSVPMVASLGSGDDFVVGSSNKDTLDGGPGKDVVYDLLGVNTILSRDAARDRVFTNAASLALVDNQDQVARFFDTNRLPGSNAIVFEKGVLYLTPDNDGSLTVVSKLGNKTFVTMDGVSKSFTGVSLIAYFGGSGNDRFVNNTSLDVVGYGGLGGNDLLVGGFSYNLLKGGSGDDTLVGRGNNTLSGDSGSDTLIGVGPTRFLQDVLDVVFALSRR